MAKLIFILTMSVSFSSVAQSENFKLIAWINSLPGASSCTQYYTPKRGKVWNYYACYDGRRLKKKSKTEKLPEVHQAIEFIQEHLSDSVYRLDLSKFNYSTEDYDFLLISGFIEDTLILINFDLFAKKMLTPISDCDSCLPIVYLPARQIDGQRIKVEVLEDTNQILKVNIGISEFSNVRNLREWLIVWEVYNEFHLFSELRIDAYFTRGRLSEEMKRYVDALKK